MVRFCICWLVFGSLLLPLPSRAADSPVSAAFFLQSIEPDPSASMLYDFLDIYGKTFAECKDIDVYLRALTYLAANGDTLTVRERVRQLESCTGLPEATQQHLRTLQASLAQPTPPVEAQTAPVTPPEVIASAPVTPVVPPETVAVVPVPPVAPDVPDVLAAPVMPVPTTPEVIHILPQVPEKQVVPVAQAKPGVRTKNTKKSAIRRTSLPVTPTIPIPSRIIPPAVLTAPVVPAPQTTTPLPSPSQPPQEVAVSSPWRTDITSRAVYRTGREGTSRLLRLENTASLGYHDWTYSVTSLYLNSGTAGRNEFTGSFFRGQQKHPLLTEENAVIPQIAYESSTVDFSLGTSPIGAEVAPLPTFRLSTAYDHLKLALFQESVTDSLLSYTGFRDPFTGKDMGRVMKAGARIGWDDTFSEHWFYGGAVTGAYLYGENVKENAQLRTEFYIGRTFGLFAVGSYSAVDHYTTNLNNYTFGHGGYYSPYIAASSVLFASWEYSGSSGRIKADISSGFLYETTRDSQQYYGTNGPRAVYKGETHRRITVNGGLEGILDLTDDVSLTSSVRVINAGDFTEARGGLALKWVF